MNVWVLCLALAGSGHIRMLQEGKGQCVLEPTCMNSHELNVHTPCSYSPVYLNTQMCLGFPSMAVPVLLLEVLPIYKNPHRKLYLLLLLILFGEEVSLPPKEIHPNCPRTDKESKESPVHLPNTRWRWRKAEPLCWFW